MSDNMSVPGALRRASDGVWVEAEFGLTERALDIRSVALWPETTRSIALAEVNGADELLDDHGTPGEMSVELSLDSGEPISIRLPGAFAAVLIRSLEVIASGDRPGSMTTSEEPSAPVTPWRTRTLAGLALLAMLCGTIALTDRRDSDVVEAAAAPTEKASEHRSTTTTAPLVTTSIATTTTTEGAAPIAPAPTVPSIQEALPAPGVGVPAAPQVAPTLPAPVTRRIDGSVEVLSRVGFAGDNVLAPGTSCSGEGGYSDLGPGAPVLFSDSGGAGVGTAQLGAGTISHSTKRTKAEFDQRERLLDSTFELRATMAEVAGDRVGAAQVRVERARLALHDYENIGTIDFSFEGRPFIAAYCRLPFSSPALPDLPGFGVSVTHRGVVSFSAGELESKGWRADLVI